jgi:SnoaL-like domain
MSNEILTKFREHAEAKDFKALEEMFADDVVLYSPVHVEPMNGKEFAVMCVSAALEILHEGAFRFTREFEGERGGVVEFVSDIDGAVINGSDMLTLNKQGKISEFKVMVRPRETGNIFCDKMSAEIVSRLKAAT